MTKSTIEKIIDEMARDFTKVTGKPAKSEVRRRIRRTVETVNALAIARTAKAFGGCTFCYGKGYATIGKDIRFCSCDRGKQLLSIFNEHEIFMQNLKEDLEKDPEGN